jgi:hypothetical protein
MSISVAYFLRGEGHIHTKLAVDETSFIVLFILLFYQLLESPLCSLLQN